MGVFSARKSEPIHAPWWEPQESVTLVDRIAYWMEADAETEAAFLVMEKAGVDRRSAATMTQEDLTEALAGHEDGTLPAKLRMLHAIASWTLRGDDGVMPLTLEAIAALPKRDGEFISAAIDALDDGSVEVPRTDAGGFSGAGPISGAGNAPAARASRRTPAHVGKQDHRENGVGLSDAAPSAEGLA